MTIHSLLAQTPFDPETTAMLGLAFDTAWEAVRRSGSPLGADEVASSTRELLAKRIIERAHAGEREPKQLVDDALAYIAISPRGLCSVSKAG